MLLSIPLLALIGLASAQGDITRSSASASPVKRADEPCAAVISLLSTDKQDRIPASLAFDCLNSVPVDVAGDKKLIDELKLVWQWHSEIIEEKRAPSDWGNGPLDAQKELDNIKSGLDSNKFNNEFQVQEAIDNITIRSGNFHWNYDPDILQLFWWQRRLGLVSVSSDPKSLPKIYVDSDLNETEHPNHSSWISEITKINGIDAYSYLGNLSTLVQCIDPDGRMNAMFTNGDQVGTGDFRYQYRYDGNSTSVEFANGTKSDYKNYARFSNEAKHLNWSSVDDGKSFFEVCCTGSLIRRNIAVTNEDNQVQSRHRRQRMKRDQYPAPVMKDPKSNLAGYFLDKDGYKDVAVLKIIDFEANSKTDSNGINFQRDIKKFLNLCIDQKKHNLLLDLRGNGGGSTHLALDLFMQLFPQDLPWYAQRYRAQDQFLAIGDALDQMINSTKKLPELQTFNNAVHYTYWASQLYTNAKGEGFANWNEFKRSSTVLDDNFTSIFHYNFSAYADFVYPGFTISHNTSGHAPFEPKNIFMFMDGLCGSSCASLHEELKNIEGVRSVVVGGRPQNKPMQAVAGSKGGEVIELYKVVDYGRRILNDTLTQNFTSIHSNLMDTRIKDLANATQLMLRAGDGESRLQLKDQVRKGDTTAGPIQYIYEAADCRIFYTAQSWQDSQQVWIDAWDAFKDDTKCVEGSTKDKSSISGGFRPYGPGQVKDEDLPGGSRPSGTLSETQNVAKPTATGIAGKKSCGASMVVGKGLGYILSSLVIAAAISW